MANVTQPLPVRQMSGETPYSAFLTVQMSPYPATLTFVVGDYITLRGGGVGTGYDYTFVLASDEAIPQGKIIHVGPLDLVSNTQEVTVLLFSYHGILEMTAGETINAGATIAQGAGVTSGSMSLESDSWSYGLPLVLKGVTTSGTIEVAF